MRRSTRSIRLAAPAVAAVAATFLLGACSSEDSGGGEESSEQGSGGGSGSGAGDDGGSAAGGDPAGFWVTGTGSGANTLVIDGGQATFASGGGDLCTGPVEGDALTLTCQNGNSDYSEATLTLDGENLTVSWASGTEESYQQVPGMDDLPTDLPTGDLPTDLPSMPEMPDMPEMPEVPEAPDM
jgi:hypothetical protein